MPGLNSRFRTLLSVPPTPGATGAHTPGPEAPAACAHKEGMAIGSPHLSVIVVVRIKEGGFAKNGWMTDFISKNSTCFSEKLENTPLTMTRNPPPPLLHHLP